MSHGWKRSTAAVSRMLRKTTPARGWRRYASVGLVGVLGTVGTVVGFSVLPAQATHGTSGQSQRSFKLPTHSVWLRHEALGGFLTQPHSKPLRIPSAFSPALAGFRQGQVAVPGASIHYVIGGSGPVLVLLHGWPMTWWEWHTVMPSLAQTHTVVAFDLPGLGASTAPATDGFTAVDTATILHQAVEALGFEDVSILSHDLGVNIAYAYAQLYPQTVTKLGVVESALNGFGLESIYGNSFHFLLNMQPPPTPEDIVNNTEAEVAYLNYLYSFAENPAAITPFDRLVWYAAYGSPAKREAGYNYYRAFPQNEAYNLAHATPMLTMPVLAMGGDDSFGTFTGQSFEGVASDVHTVVAPNSGHYVPEENPAFLAECANLFFSSATQAPSGFEGCLSS
jgi:pimeloyl-ACP methyl ester carboxylesterase